MEWIDQFFSQGTEDAYHFVFDERDATCGAYTMLAMSEDGWSHSHWTRGPYDPNGTNEHLGTHISRQQIGAGVLDAFFSRLSIPDEWEQAYEQIEQYVREEEQ